MPFDMHWKRFEKNAKLRKHVAEWREELELKLRAKGVKSMIDEATLGGRGQATAARWLAEKGWLTSKAKGKVGRPAKDTTEEDAALKAEVNKEFAEDLARLKIN